MSHNKKALVRLDGFPLSIHAEGELLDTMAVNGGYGVSVFVKLYWFRGNVVVNAVSNVAFDSYDDDHMLCNNWYILR